MISKNKKSFKSDDERRASYKKAAASYDESRFITVIEETSMNILFNFLDIKSDAKLLDVAAGTGRTSIPLTQRGINVTAIDLTEEMMDVMRAKVHKSKIKNIKIITANAKKMPFEDSSFDAVIAFRFLHLFDHEEKRLIIDEIHRVVKPNGKVIIEFNNSGMLGRNLFGLLGKFQGKSLNSGITEKEIIDLYRSHIITKIQGFGLPMTGSIAKRFPSISKFLLNLSIKKYFKSISRMFWVISKKEI